MAATPSAGDKKNIVKMAYIYFQEGRWDKAIEEYKKLLNMDPEDVNTHNMLGDVYVKKGSIKEAYEQYQRVANDLTAKGQGDKAAVVNKKIAALDPTTLSSEARNKQNLIKQSLKAEAAMEQGDFQSAIEAFTEVLKLDPENIPAYGKLADLLVSQGKIQEAVQQFAVLGTAFLKNRLYKKAQEAFQKIIELDPNQVEARINLAQIFIKQGSESDAKKEYLTVAEIFMGQGDLDRAQQYSQKAIEFKSIEAHYVLGQVLFKKRQFAEAKGEFENLLRFKVNHVGALVHLGQVFLELNQLDKAGEQFAKAQKAEKDNPRVQEALAELNSKKGNPTEAVNYYLQASAWFLGKKDHKRALEMARKAEATDAQSPDALRGVALALKDEGKKEEALGYFTKAFGIFEQQGNSIEAAAVQHQMHLLGSAPKAAPAAPTAPAAAPAAKQPADKVLDLEDEPPQAPAAEAPVEMEAPPEMQAPEEVPVEPAAEAAVEPEAPAEAPDEEAAPEEVAEETPAAEAEVPAEPEYAEGGDAGEAQLASQLEIAQNYIQQNLVEEAIEIYQQLLEIFPDHPDVRARLNEAYTLYVKSGEEVLGALEAEKQAKEAEDKRLREEVERRTREEQERKAHAEREKKARDDAESKVRAEVERKIREEMEKKIRAEMEKKAHDEVERKVREEMERKLREEADKRSKTDGEKKLREEAERKAREAAERKVREDLEQRSRQEAEKKIREEIEKKVREEVERKARDESERKAREEAERKAKDSVGAPHDEVQRRSKEEADRLAREILERADRASAERKAAAEKKSAPSKPAAPPPKAEPSDESKDDFMTIAVADIYVRQGLYEEAHKIYKRITDMEPDNYEAKKKLTDLDALMKSKGIHKTAAPAPAEAPPAPPKAESAPPPPHPEKESVAKKKHGKVGYV